MEKGFLTQLVLDGLQDAVRVAQHAGGRRADLNEVLSHRLTQKHRVESRYFVDSHWSDLQHFSHLNDKQILV